jgi:Golgi nucleoside diphosphatase
MDLQSFQVCSLEKSCDKHRVPRSTLTVVFALLLLLVASLCEAIEPSGLSSSASSSSSHRQQKFLVLIDAGSAGSRIHVFSWRKGVVYSTLTEVCQKKINPGLNVR